MFQLIEPTTFTLTHINLRREKHGKKKVSAVDFDFVLGGDNFVLDLLDERLRTRLYYDPDDESGQQSVDGVKRVLRKLLLPRLGPKIPWGEEHTGMKLTIVYGVGDERSNLEFDDGKVVVKSIETKENGQAAIAWRFSTIYIPSGAIDKLKELTDSNVTGTLVQNEALRDRAVQDGDPEDDDEDDDAPDATDLFAGAVGGETDEATP